MGTLFLVWIIVFLILVIGVVAWAVIFDYRDRGKEEPVHGYTPASGQEDKESKAG